MATEYKQPETGLGSVEETNRLLQEASKQTGIAAPTFSPTGAITSEILSGNEPAIQLLEPTPDTTSGRIAGKSQAILTEDELQQKAAQKAEEDRAKLQESQAKSAGILERIGITKKEVTAQVEEETDLSGQKLLRTEAVKKLRTAEVAELGELERLQGAGLSDVQRGAQERAIHRKYGFEKLEAQLSFHMANADVVSAQETLNDRLTLELEPLYAQLDLQKGVSEQIYDQLTTSEKREWDLVVGRTENAIQDQKDLSKYRSGIITTAMQNGVPLPSYVVQELNRATTQEEINSVLARNGISLAKPEKPDKEATLVASRTSQILDGFITFEDLTTTEAAKVRDDLFKKGFGSDTPPTWFKEYIQTELRQSVLPSALREEWIKYRDGILSKAKAKSGGGIEDINIDDL